MTKKCNIFNKIERICLGNLNLTDNGFSVMIVTKKEADR